MIRLQPDIIVARLSSAENFTTAILISEGSNSESQATHDTKKPQRMIVGLHHQDLVTRQYLCWASSRSWIVFLLGSLLYHRRYLKHKKKRGVEIHTKYTLPGWLSSKAFDLRLHDLSGWQVNLRTYRTLSCTHSFFEYAARGDFDGLQNMLLTGQALVTDRESEHGQTALHVSVSKHAMV
jgi:hypothetical protein